MRFLLTSAGVTNGSIRAALTDLLGKPIEESTAICIPTASYGFPGGPGGAWRTLRAFESLGWREFGVLELTTLTTAPESYWLPAFVGADCVIVGGGNAGYLSYWMHATGMAERLTGLLWDKPSTVYLGAGAGSMIVTRGLHRGQEDEQPTSATEHAESRAIAPTDAVSDRALELLDLVVRPHLNTWSDQGAIYERTATSGSVLDVPLYAIDDASAVVVRDGVVRVVSEGEWAVFAPQGQEEHAALST